MTLKPCADCPFRADTQFVLSSDRAQQIARDVIQGDSAFHCHKTVRYGDDGNDNLEDAKPCIGAIKAIAKERGDARANLWVRMAARFGHINLDAIDQSTPVHNASEFIENLSI